jgi:hypothetical protein
VVMTTPWVAVRVQGGLWGDLSLACLEEVDGGMTGGGTVGR